MQSSGPLDRLRSPRPLTCGVRRCYPQKLFMTESEISENRRTEYKQACYLRATERLPIFAPRSSRFFQSLPTQDYFWFLRTVTRRH
jgi:hypothetical protein